MCKLLKLEGHPMKFVDCGKDCNKVTSSDCIKTAAVIYGVLVLVSVVILSLLN